jgi:hypothetical protein
MCKDGRQFSWLEQGAWFEVEQALSRASEGVRERGDLGFVHDRVARELQ